MLVSIVGKAGSGKDLIGAYLASKLNLKEARSIYRTIAFADILKKHLMTIFGLSHAQVYGNLKEVEDKRYKKDDGSYWTPREMMQYYGESMRSIDKNIWIRLFIEKMKSNTFISYIVTDVRHRNELEAVRSMGSMLIHVERPNKNSIHGEGHISETSLDNYDINPDFAINNDSSIDDLYYQLDSVIKYINKGDFRYGK